MNILLVGSGGREHALAWKLSQSEKCDTLYVAPGSDAIAREPKVECVGISVTDLDTLTSFAKEKDIELVVVGPEVPLVMGLSNRLRDENIPVFGPEQAGAELEGSKGFMKDLCAEFNIPTASYARFTVLSEAVSYVEKQNFPLVIKADGLAAGKGVIIAQDVSEALDAVMDMLSGNSFGDAGASIVVEEFLEGEEVSFFAITDGKTVLPFNSAQDHKRAFDDDEGPNTGGMGAYSPARTQVWDAELEQDVMDKIIYPTLEGLRSKDISYCGVLYAGLMISNRKPYLIEYNARFGDPECQPLMMRLKSDLVELLYDAATGHLNEWQDKIKWRNDACINIVYAAEGYPSSYQKGTVISKLSELPETGSMKLFHAGTKKDESGKWVSNGGRVLGLTVMGETVANARAKAYESITKIEWDEGFYRTDIGARAT